jgi:hypothetical protein
MSSLNTHGGAWSNRAGVWPLSERRLILSSKKDIVSQQWIDSFNQLLQTMNGNGSDGGDFDGISKINMIENQSQNSDTTGGI